MLRCLSTVCWRRRWLIKEPITCGGKTAEGRRELAKSVVAAVGLVLLVAALVESVVFLVEWEGFVSFGVDSVVYYGFEVYSPVGSYFESFHYAAGYFSGYRFSVAYALARFKKAVCLNFRRLSHINKKIVTVSLYGSRNSMTALKKIRHSEYFKSSVVIVIILVVSLGCFLVWVLLNVSVRVVESGSMCVPSSGACDGWTHPFNQTLHKGDIIIIQGVNPKDLNANYPNSDIIVYNRPDNPTETPIVHRIVAVTEIDGKLYFQTKGDGNGQTWPAPVSPSEYDAILMSGYPDGVPQDYVLGRVVMRIPYFGFITLFFDANDWALPAIVALILLLVVLQFVFPMIKRKQG